MRTMLLQKRWQRDHGPGLELVGRHGTDICGSEPIWDFSAAASSRFWIEAIERDELAYGVLVGLHDVWQVHYGSHGSLGVLGGQSAIRFCAIAP